MTTQRSLLFTDDEVGSMLGVTLAEYYAMAREGTLLTTIKPG